MILPPLGGDPSSVTVSGFSSGSSISTIMHVIYPETIKGAGLVAGTPYGWGMVPSEATGAQKEGSN